MLCEKLDFGFSAIAEILLDSILDDEKRLGEIVAETKSKSQMRLNQAAHSAAVMRASSYFSAESAFDDCTGGIGFYQFLEETAKHFEEKKGEVIAKLKRDGGTPVYERKYADKLHGSNRRSGRA